MTNSPELRTMPLGADAAEKITIDVGEQNRSLNTLEHKLVILKDTYSGSYELTLTGLPKSLKVFLAEAVEINVNDNSPHRGGAVYSTSSVNLHANGGFAVVRFNVAWGAPLKSGLMIVMG